MPPPLVVVLLPGNWHAIVNFNSWLKPLAELEAAADGYRNEKLQAEQSILRLFLAT
jgi:hypothetical protein